MYTHDGATAGYRANLDHIPSLGLTIAFLSNTSEFDGGASAAGAVRNLFIVPNPPQARDMVAYNVSNETLDSYQGWYRNTRTGGGVRLSVRDNKLNATQVGTLQPVSDRVFAAGNNRVELFPDHRKNGFMFINGAKDSIYFTAVEPASTDGKVFNDYVGEYYSTEAEARFFVSVKDGKLFVQQKGKPEMQLQPTYKDGFEFPGGVGYYERDRNNKITTFKVSNGRARNVEFKKVQ
jgi:hypothetical protein